MVLIQIECTNPCLGRYVAIGLYTVVHLAYLVLQEVEVYALPGKDKCQLWLREVHYVLERHYESVTFDSQETISPHTVVASVLINLHWYVKRISNSWKVLHNGLHLQADQSLNIHHCFWRTYIIL